MNIIIIADKFQKRMKSKGCVGLIKINNRTNVIQNQLSALKIFYPKAKIIYIYGFENKKFLSFINKNPILSENIDYVYNENYLTHNYAYSLYLAKNYLNDNTIILFGDHILNPKIFENFDKNKGSQMFINKKQKNRLGCIIHDNKIENISYDLDNYLSEIYYLSKSDSIKLQQIVSNSAYHNYFIFELINKMIDQNIILSPFFIDNKVSNISYKAIS